MPIRSLPRRPSLELDKKLAKRLLRAARDSDATALSRITAIHPRFTAARGVASDELKLADVELVLAREYGFASWPRYKHFVETLLADRAVRAATLTQAVCSNQLSRGLSLLEHEPDLATFDFYAACACGELDFVAQALGKDGSLAQQAGGPNGWQPLVYACFSRFWRRDPDRAQRLLALAQLLLDHGADPNSFFTVAHDGKPEPQTCVFAASGIANHAGLTRLLLQAGGRVDDDEALYHASEFKDVTCLGLLLGAKPPPAKVSYCLGRALDFDNEPAVLLYLEHGADPGHVVPWQQHRSHLHKAVLARRSLTTIAAMLERGADPNLADATGTSPYGYALQRAEHAIAALLEQHGAKLANDAHLSSAPDPDLLMRAARRNDVVEMRELLAAGVDVNAPLELPALHAACYAGHLAAARLLVEHGASLTQLSHYGGTPLSSCIYGSADCFDAEGGPSALPPDEVPARDYAELTEWLIEQGAALPQSIWGGSEAVQEVLRRHGVAE